MVKTIVKAAKATPILCQFSFQVVFHLDKPAFSPPIPTDVVRWTSPPSGAGATHAAHALTEEDNPNTATLADVRSSKKIQTNNNQQNLLLQYPGKPKTLEIIDYNS